MVANPDINNLIWMYRHYQAQAERCFEVYPDLVDAYLIYDYNMQMAEIYEEAILSHI